MSEKPEASRALTTSRPPISPSWIRLAALRSSLTSRRAVTSLLPLARTFCSTSSSETGGKPSRSNTACMALAARSRTACTASSVTGRRPPSTFKSRWRML